MKQQFPIETAVRFLWRDPEGALRIGAGVTRNISRNEVTIRAQQIPSCGADVQVMVEMPSQRVNVPSGRLLGKGVAVRVEHEDGRPTSFAAKVRLQSGWATSSESREEPLFENLHCPEVTTIASWTLPVPTNCRAEAAV